MKTKKTQLHSVNYTKNLVCVLFVFLIVLMFLYAYFINESVLNVVERKKIEKNILAANSRISILESRYFDYTHDIDLKLAMSLGFKETKDVIFVERRTKQQALSLRNR